jgi:hypothetical protein
MDTLWQGVADTVTYISDAWVRFCSAQSYSAIVAAYCSAPPLPPSLLTAVSKEIPRSSWLPLLLLSLLPMFLPPPMLQLKPFLDCRNMNLCDCCYWLQGQLPELSETDIAALEEAGCPPQECSAIMGGGMQHSRATEAFNFVWIGV